LTKNLIWKQISKNSHLFLFGLEKLEKPKIIVGSTYSQQFGYLLTKNLIFKQISKNAHLFLFGLEKLEKQKCISGRTYSQQFD